MELKDSVPRSIAYALLMLANLWAVWLVSRLYQVRTFPAIAVRRFELMALSVAYAVFYDFFWAIDGYAWIRTGTSVSCGLWEFFDGVYINSNLLILTLRAWVLYASFRRVQMTDGIAAKATSVQISSGTFSVDVKRQLRFYRRLTSAKFMTAVFVGVSGFFFVLFFINWGHFPDLIRLSWRRFEETYGSCYISWSYNSVYFLQYFSGLAGLAFAYASRGAEDAFRLRRETALVIGLWLAYAVMLKTLNAALGGYSETVIIFVWLAFRVLLNVLFLYLPLKSVTADNSPGTGTSDQSKIVESSGGSGDLGRIAAVLADADASEAFRRFLGKEFCPEFFHFLVQVEQYERLHRVASKTDPAGDGEPRLDEADQLKAEAIATEIVRNFLTLESPLELNVATPLKRSYEQSVGKPSFATAEFFEPAKREVCALLASSSLPRFFATPAGRDFQRRLKEKASEAVMLTVLAGEAKDSSHPPSHSPVSAMKKPQGMT